MNPLDYYINFFPWVYVDFEDIIDIALRVFAGWYGNFTDFFNVLNGSVGNMVAVVLSKIGVGDPVLGFINSAIDALFLGMTVLDLLGVSALITIITISFITIIKFLLDILNPIA